MRNKEKLGLNFSKLNELLKNLKFNSKRPWSGKEDITDHTTSLMPYLTTQKQIRITEYMLRLGRNSEK